MASPIAATAEMEVKNYVGNDLNLNLTGNVNLSFIVIGDNCDVQLRDNLASIQIIGNNCRLHVLSGGGTVLYIGNDGTVYLGRGIDEDVVRFLGNNGTIIPEGGTNQPSEIVSPMAATFAMETKQYVGNYLNLDLKGKRNLSYLVVGNFNDVQLRHNRESIKIVGNGCTLRVYSGNGNINYIGNNGTIYLDRSIDKDVVTFTGNNINIYWMSTIQRRSSVEDVGKRPGSMDVMDLNEACNISLPNVKTSVKTFMHIASTIGLPNIKIQFPSPVNTTPSTADNLAIYDAEVLPSLIN